MPDTASARPGRAKLWLCAREVGCAPPSPAIILLPLFLERLGVFSSNSLLILTDPPTYPPRSCHAIPSFPFSSLPCVCGVIVSRFRQFALSHPSIHPPLRMHYVTRSKRQLTNLGDMFIACLVISLFFFSSLFCWSRNRDVYYYCPAQLAPTPSNQLTVRPRTPNYTGAIIIVERRKIPRDSEEVSKHKTYVCLL